MKYIKLIGSGIFTVGVFIFYLGFKVKNYNLYFLIAGGLLGLVGFILVAFVDKKEEEDANNEYKAWKDKLIKNGIRIEVDLNKVRIKSNNYREEILEDEYSPLNKYDAIDALAGKDIRQFANVKQSVLVYEAEVNGTNRKFMSPVIDKDEITLQFLLANQKKTWIYSDRLNPTNYFFDIEFLFE